MQWSASGVWNAAGTRAASRPVTTRGVLRAWRRSGHSIEGFAKERGVVAQRVRWWKNKLEGTSRALVRSRSPLALLPVQVTESAPPKRGEPVAVYLAAGTS